MYLQLQEPPFLDRVKTDKRAKSSQSEFQGFIPDLIEKICNRLKVPYQIKLVADGGYGVQDRTGRWNGIVGEVMRGV